MLTPPLLPHATLRPTNWKRVVFIVVLGLLLLAGAGYLVVRGFLAADFVRRADNKFGDQHLKTTVALVELYKVRFGHYPASLRELKFVGEWDQLALQSVRYTPNSEGSAYYVEVVRGWAGKPTFTMPEEFWRGTGYSPTLKPAPR